MLLSRSEICAAVENGRISIEPFNEENLTSNGYMLSADKIRIPKLRWTVQKGFIAISKLTAFRVMIKERLKFSDDISGDLYLSSTLSKKGVLASFSKIDAGFDGNLELTAFNSSSRTIDISSGDYIAELVFVPVSTEPPHRRATYPSEPSLVTTMPEAAEEHEIARPRLEPRDPRLGGEPCIAFGCIECCLETEMPLSKGDVERIEALGQKNFYENKDGWLVLKNKDGHCVFLDGRACLIYEARPEGCRFYPFVYNADTGGGIMDRDCPHTVAFLGNEEMNRDLSRLVDKLTREMKRRKVLRI